MQKHSCVKLYEPKKVSQRRPLLAKLMPTNLNVVSTRRQTQTRGACCRRRHISLNLYDLVQLPKAMKIPAAKAAVDKGEP